LTFRTQGVAAPRDALRVTVRGWQWWWEFRYPDLDVVTANELHLPVGRAVVLDLEGPDVIHSFWVPRLGGKRDVVPGRPNRTVLAAGMWPNTPDNVAAWVRDPQRLKPGVKMPDLGLTDEQAKAVAAYLTGLK